MIKIDSEGFVSERIRVSILRHCLILLTVLTCGLSSVQAGTFKNPTLIQTSYDPISLTVGDFNHDGNLDLIYLDGTQTRTLHVLLGNGNGTFTHGQDIALPTGICCLINQADVNNDGIVDLVIGGNSASNALIGVLLGNGDGTFKPTIVSTLVANTFGNYPAVQGQMGLGDINGDGNVDLVVGDAMNNVIWVALGDGTGKFAFSSLLRAGYPGPAYLLDLNGDGHLDIVTLDRLGALALVMLGNGDGTFQSGVNYSLGASAGALLLADIEGDGHPDVVSETYPYNITVLKGQADGTFASPVAVATVPPDAVLSGVGDFTGDGILDLICFNSAGIGILSGKGSLTYGTLVSSLAAASNSSIMAQGDFNKDGHNDLALGVDGGILILFGHGDGTFASADIYDMGHGVGTTAVADFNGDGFPDIAATMPAPFPRLLLGNGLGTFTLAADQNTSYGSQTPGASMVVANFDGDGKKDLLAIEVSASSPYGGPVVLFGNGDGTFQQPVVPTYGSIVVGDINGDGRSDMVSISGPSIVSTLGQSNRAFTYIDTGLRNTTFAGIAGLADFNKDGKPDLLVYEYTALEIWLGNGDGTFSYEYRLDMSGYVPQQVAAIADLDGDGNLDFILAPGNDPLAPSGPLLIFYGNGDGTFQPAAELPISHQYWQVVVADVNRDGKPDLVLSDGLGLAVITNLGSRNWSAEDHYVAGSTLSQINVVDVNGDGFPDIVTSAGGSIVSVLLNQPNGQEADGAPTAAAFTITPEPANYGQPIQLSITVSSAVGMGATPTGTVTFNVDGSFLGTVPLTNGKVTYTSTSALITGQHEFIATYDGDNKYRPLSFTALHNVLPPVYPTQTTLTATPSSILASQTVRLTATVTSNPEAIGGIVTFLDGTSTLGNQLIDVSGVAVFDTALLAAGSHHVLATFQGFQDKFGLLEIYSPSTSAPVTVTVESNATTTSLTTSANSVTAGAVVTLTADVSSSAGVPFGGVAFYDGTTLLGASSLQSDGSASFSTASLAVGTHGIAAVFGANATFATSTSSIITLTVVAAAANLTPTVIALSVSNNGTAASSLTAQVSAANGSPSGIVAFMSGGAILGKVATNASGTAALTASSLSGGTHNLTASFEGSAQFAPSVSPSYRDESPANGPGFSLNVGGGHIVVTGEGSVPLSISVVPSSGFLQMVQFSCLEGVPEGYACTFAPGNVTGGGTSALTIQHITTAQRKPSPPRGAYGLWFVGLACGLALVLGRSSNHRLMGTVTMLFVVWLAGCGTPSRPTARLAVLSIQASSGTGSAAIVHSAQIELKIQDDMW